MPQGHDKGGMTENFQRPEGPKRCDSCCPVFSCRILVQKRDWSGRMGEIQEVWILLKNHWYGVVIALPIAVITFLFYS